MRVSTNGTWMGECVCVCKEGAIQKKEGILGVRVQG